ncbi:tyrosine-type recombinase/integrase, partial [Nocardia caishijiensis]
DGRWEGAAYLGTVSGTIRRLRVYGKTRKEAHDKLAIKMADADRGIPMPERSWTVGAYLDYFMADVAPSRLRPKTLELYESAIRVHLKPLLGSQSMTNLSVSTLQRLLNQRLAEGKSVRTVRLVRTILSAALTRAMREELVTRNVARLVELPAWQRKDITPWTTDEAARFLEVTRNEPLYPAFLLLILYGMRRGEVLGLRWSDVDWDANELHIRQQLQQVRNELEAGPVKTSAGRRDLPLLLLVRQALQRHQVAHDANQTRPDDDLDLVFLSEAGTPIWPRNFVRTFHQICERAGLPRIKLHHLRHTVATFLNNFGIPARDAQIILGHAHISTTQQIYQHGDTRTQRKALDRVGRMLLEGRDGYVSRQTQPSMAEIVVRTASINSGGSSGARTHDTLLKSLSRVGGDPFLTPVIQQLRARLSMHILADVAVNQAVKTGTQNGQPVLVLQHWMSLRDCLAPQPRRLVDRLIASMPAESLHPRTQGAKRHASIPGQSDSSSHRSESRSGRALPPGINQTPTGHGGGH